MADPDAVAAQPRPAAARAVLLHPADALAAALAALAFLGWAWASGAPPRAGWCVFPALAWGLQATGDLCERAARRAVAPRLRLDPAGRLLMGTLAASSALFALAWCSPLGIGGNALLAAALVAAGRAALAPAPARRLREELPALAAVGLALLAATLWSRDALGAVVVPPAGDVVLRSWIDSFIHAAHVRSFREAHGGWTLHSIGLAGAPTFVYHYASYLLPALVSRVAGLTAYVAFGAFLTPLAVTALGLAAHLLVRAWWGPWAGLGACAAALALPDAVQQGAAASYFGYHWLAQISPSLDLGIAQAGLAWAVVLAGARRGRRDWVALGLAAAAWAVVFKAQVFFACALPLALFAVLALRGVRLRGRLAGLALLALGLAAAVALSRQVRAFPALRFDPAASQGYLRLVQERALNSLSWRWPGPLGPWTPRPRALAGGAALLLVVTFGWWLPAWAGLALALRRRASAPRLLFPALLVAAYVATALLVAPDAGGVGTPDELLHRPLAWAAWGLAAWLGGALVALLRAGRRPRGWRAAALAAGLAALLAVPAGQGRGIQAQPWAPRYTDRRVPRGLWEAVAFLRERTAPGEVFQVTGDDPRLVITGLAERQILVTDNFRGGWAPPGADAALAAVRRLRARADAAALAADARALGLRWYLAFPGEALGWPPAVLERPAFAAGGYRVYDLAALP